MNKSVSPKFWAFLRTEMTDFPTLSYTSNGKIPTLIHLEKGKPEKGIPFGEVGAEPPRIDHYREYLFPGSVTISFPASFGENRHHL